MAIKTKPKKRGRKPADGVRAMSNSERQRRYRDRVRQAVQSGGGDEADALRKARQQIAEKAEDILDPIHGRVIDARYYTADALVWMDGLQDAIFTGTGIARGLSRQVRKRIGAIEQTLRGLESAVENQQAADRRRELSADAALSEELAELRHTVEAQAREIEVLRRGDEELRRLALNILDDGEERGRAASSLRLMREQLLASLALVRTVEDAMSQIKGEMYSFAIGGKAMNRETRKGVFAGIVAIDEAARRAKNSLLERRGGPPAWARGERDWT